MLAMGMAVLLAGARADLIDSSMAGLMPVFWHFLLVGWITQIIMGVSVWMFPRKRRGKVGGGETWAWAAFFCINAGLALRAIAEPVNAISVAGAWVQWGVVVSAGLQVAGGLAYVIGIWPRVKGKRKRKRKKEGEGS